MATKEQIERLLEEARAARLEGLDWLARFSLEEIAREYNGIGPEWSGEKCREWSTRKFRIFEPAAVLHDMRNAVSDGSDDGFVFANREFLANCLKLANHAYPWYSWKRYRARATAFALYEFVSSAGGYVAWQQAHQRYLLKTNKGVNAMNRMMMMCAVCLAVLWSGCTATKIKYEKDEKGKVEYSIWHNGHWLKTEAETLSGGMSQDGKFEVDLTGLKSAPSEEFNKTMKTYTSAVVTLAQIAAAAYNPSASAALANMQGSAATAKRPIAAQPSGVSQSAIQDVGATNGVECAGGSCENK